MAAETGMTERVRHGSGGGLDGMMLMSMMRRCC